MDAPKPTSMKSESNNWRMPALVGGLVIIALLINYAFFTKAASRRAAKAQEQREAAEAVSVKVAAEKLLRDEKAAEEKHIREVAEAKVTAEAARKKAIQDAAAEHARFLTRYLNAGFNRKTGVASIAVAIENEQGTVNPKIATALTQRLQTDEVQLFNSFFKPEFVADNFVTRLFSGETGIIEQLELTNSLDAVLIGRQTVAYSTNAELGNTVTANLNLELTTLPVGMTREGQSWNFAANGGGVRPQEARQLAEDRIIEQIARNTNLVLAPRF
jgi:hypothetical protein